MNSDFTSAITNILPELRRYAHYLSDHPDTAEELVQQTVERLLNRKSHLGEIDDLKKYMFSILRNLHNDFLRQKQRDKVHDPDAEPIDPRSDADQRLSCQQVLAGIDNLPPAHREVLTLIKVGHSYAQIAERLNLPLGTVMSRISRARTALRSRIDMPSNETVLQWLDI
ncbi:MAG: RNA polymerase sigma factor [Rhodobacteraceae bacterium]|nr:RNA polymerase sigma factor [Paracoccaceae bacterium]